jgi:hypothetical protein
MYLNVYFHKKNIFLEKGMFFAGKSGEFTK